MNLYKLNTQSHSYFPIDKYNHTSFSANVDVCVCVCRWCVAARVDVRVDGVSVECVGARVDVSVDVRVDGVSVDGVSVDGECASTV